MPLAASIRRRITKVKHRRSVSSTSDAASDVSTPDSVDLFAKAPPLPPRPLVAHMTGPAAPMRSGSPLIAPTPLPDARPLSMMVRTNSDGPSRPPRFTRPRVAPAPPSPPLSASPPHRANTIACHSPTIAHQPPPRGNSVSPPAPAVPRRAMPPWRADLISLATSYAPFSDPTGSTHVNLIRRLHDPALTERQALALIRSYVDNIHASARHTYSDISDYSDSD